MASKSGKTAPKGAGSAESSPTLPSELQTLAAQPQPLTLAMLQDSLKLMQIEMTKNFNKKIDEANEKVNDMINDKIQDVSEKIEKKIEIGNSEIRTDILLALKGLANNVEYLEQQIEEIRKITADLREDVQDVQEKRESDTDEITLLHYRNMEFAIRVRGVKEVKQENLRELMIDALAQAVGMRKEELGWQIDKIYRANSKVARLRNLPRDIVIYFNNRTLRNDILQATYQNKLQVGGQEVMTLKEIPPKMLRARKEFSFLVEELKRQQLSFRWEVPAGISLIYEGERHRLNTVQKARDFFTYILKAGTPRSPEGRRKEDRAQRHELQLEGATAGQSELDITLADKTVDLFGEERIREQKERKEQRQTRATTKRIQELSRQQSQMLTEEGTMQAVGGTRPKVIQKLDIQAMFQLLEKLPDGK